MAQIQKEFSLCNFDLAEFKHLLEQKATALYLEVARSIILQTEPLVGEWYPDNVMSWVFACLTSCKIIIQTSTITVLYVHTYVHVTNTRLSHDLTFLVLHG